MNVTQQGSLEPAVVEAAACDGKAPEVPAAQRASIGSNEVQRLLKKRISASPASASSSGTSSGSW
jgi:hypothetical protein